MKKYLSALDFDRKLYYAWKSNGLLLDYKSSGRKWNSLDLNSACWLFLVEQLRQREIPYETIKTIKENYAEKFAEMVDDIIKNDGCYYLFGNKDYLRFTQQPEDVLLEMQNTSLACFSLHIIIKDKINHYAEN